MRSSVLALALVALLVPLGITEAETALESQLVLCNQCHGKDGNSTTKGIPSLAGQPETFLVTQLIYFREGLRSSEKMSPFAAKLDDKLIEALAAHFAALPPESTAGDKDPALVKRGQLLAAAGRCGECHLPDFSGRDQMPRLAGQREDYLRTTLIAYRDGTRGGADTTMNDIMQGVSDDDIRALAHFLARSQS
jgi:cytochrome c553